MSLTDRSFANVGPAPRRRALRGASGKAFAGPAGLQRDAALKAFVDPWLHIALENGSFKKVYAVWFEYNRVRRLPCEIDRLSGP
jgi:hypothetical protein